MKRALALFAACAALALLPACRIAGAFGSAASSLFAKPREVPNKIKDPVRPNARLAVLWVGHATALIQIDDKFILTDPVFTATVGEFSKRVVEPGLDVDAVPPLDAVLISHVHFDHLSLGSLSMLEKKIRMLVMPQGGTGYLTDFAFPDVELETWQSWERDGLRVTATPVEHLAFRYGVDYAWARRTYTGYVVEYHGIKVYFGGDSAYDDRDFAQTGARFPGIDLALLPIGPVEPHDLMRRMHMDPAEAFHAFLDLGAKRMVPIHYDTFVNSTDKVGDALPRLLAEAKKWDIGKREVVPLAIGQQRVLLAKGEKSESEADAGAPPPDEE